jgi:hypothetical protein
MNSESLNRLHINGYALLSVNHGPWMVSSKTHQLGSFATREEAIAYVTALPPKR